MKLINLSLCPVKSYFKLLIFDTMKFPLLLFFMMLTSISIFSQTIEYNEIDEFTGIHTIMTKGWKGQFPKKADRIDPYSNLYISMSYSKTKEAIEYFSLNIYLFNVGDMGCMSKHDGKVMLLMDSGETFTFMQRSDTNC